MESFQIPQRLEDRGPTNVVKSNSPFTGRHKEMHKVISNLKKAHIRLINVFGHKGMGKTKFI